MLDNESRTGTKDIAALHRIYPFHACMDEALQPDRVRRQPSGSSGI